MKRIINYWYNQFKNSFKHRIGLIDHKTKTYQYWNVWTNKVWNEKSK